MDVDGKRIWQVAAGEATILAEDCDGLCRIDYGYPGHHSGQLFGMAQFLTVRGDYKVSGIVIAVIAGDVLRDFGELRSQALWFQYFNLVSETQQPPP